MPALFNFTREGQSWIVSAQRERLADALVELSTRPDLIRQLVPPHAEKALLADGVDVDNFDPIPLEQLRISLDVSDTISEGKKPVKADMV